jgi:uncharacterized protein YndB with AHSA1/START domain
MSIGPGETSVTEHEVRVAAPPETVFSYLTDPAKMVRWIGAEATLDPRPGGVSRIKFSDEAVMLGMYVQIVPHSRVVFSWGWENDLFSVPPASTVVEFALTRDTDGTRLRVTHRQLPDAAVDIHRNGWEHYVERLAAVASGEDPGPDPWLDPEVAERGLRAGRET